MSHFLNSFKYASRGLIRVFRYERNMKIHGAMAALVLILAWLFQVEAVDLVILLILIALVMGAELVNTCVEEIGNILRDRYHLPYEASRDIRDMAAGFVWLMAIIAAVGGLIIFWQY